MVVVVGRIYLYLLFFSLSFSLVSEGENGGEGGVGLDYRQRLLEYGIGSQVINNKKKKGKENPVLPIFLSIFRRGEDICVNWAPSNHCRERPSHERIRIKVTILEPTKSITTAFQL